MAGGNRAIKLTNFIRTSLLWAGLLGTALQVSTSMGVTFYPQAQELGAEQLLRQADQAMYRAKAAGKNRYQVFNAD